MHNFTDFVNSYFDTFTIARNSSFWTHVEVPQPKPNSTSNSGIIQKIVSSISFALINLADSYLSTDSNKVVWTLKEVEMDSPNIDDSKRKVWVRVETPFIKSSGILNTLLKVTKVVSFLSIIPPLLAILPKVYYRNYVVNDFINHLRYNDPANIKYTIEMKKEVIKKLPEWLESHFPNQKEEFRSSFSNFYYDIDDVLDHKNEFNFDDQQKEIIKIFSQEYNKSSLMLRGLTVPKDENVQFTALIEKMLVEIWKKTFASSSSANHYAYYNPQIVSNDMEEIISFAFRRENIEAQDENKMKILMQLENSKVYQSLDMSISRPFFSINVAVPSIFKRIFG